MAAAGLTHGGFYRHFESKDQLVTEACEKAFSTMFDGMMDRAARQSPGNAKGASVNNYLSTRHRNESATGCPLAALGNDLCRADSKTRDAASDGYSRLVEIINNQIDDLPPHQAKARATAMVSAMVGGMILARLVSDPITSNKILKDTRDFILDA